MANVGVVTPRSAQEIKKYLATNRFRSALLSSEVIEREFNKVVEKFKQALDIRWKILLKRNEAIESYTSNNIGEKKNALKKLERCLYDDKKLLKAIKEGPSRGIKILKEIRHWLKNLKFSPEDSWRRSWALGRISLLVDILKRIDRNLCFMESRIDEEGVELKFLEEAKFSLEAKLMAGGKNLHGIKVLENVERKYFRAFVKSWEKEIKLDREIAREIDYDTIDKLEKDEDTMKKLFPYPSYFASGGGLLMGFIGAISKSPSEGVSHFIVTGVIFGLITGLVVQYISYVNKLEDIEVRAITDTKKRMKLGYLNRLRF